MNIVFENENLIAVDKPHGWLTTPARSADDPRPCLGRELQAAVGSQVYPVHRLDFEVGGLVLFARTAQAHRVAQGWFERAEVVKTYCAWSDGSGGPGDWVEWRSKLVRGKKRTFEAAHGLASVTRARVVGATASALCWELQPVTGRPHQLRVEMAKHGYAIQGDLLYGGRDVGRPGWMALRAVRLDFPADRLGLPSSLVAEGL